jgi:hypothetical protein
MVIGSGAVLLFKQILLLQLENTDRPQRVDVRIDSTETFSIFSIHSIYREPVTEEFQADRDGIVLRGVRTESAAVKEYYRFEDTRDFHPLHLRVGELFIRAGEGEGHGLIVRGRKIYFSDVGRRGDRIRLSVRSVSLGYYLFSKYLE